MPIGGSLNSDNIQDNQHSQQDESQINSNLGKREREEYDPTNADSIKEPTVVLESK